ncbi:hypothetical protein E4U41_007711 [Claviceps citrina]|nr:hypothetical protein E4U41_007711 [Claviceps citrina]
MRRTVNRPIELLNIRIDFFRGHPNRTPPLVCFLSHVHSDHLAGLETLRSPFVYCSPATREILLRLEKYTCRIDYARGVLEARQQTYKHLRKVLKALPLETPTTMELRPGYKIQVTLFDANHCPGSTMFLIEGQGKAIFYTGDVRAEPWFVNSIARNPILLEYTHGLRTLDKLYLDTSFIEDVPFQTKSEGIAELLKRVKMYPPDTVFHLQAWTFGYEEVWIALSKALNSRVRLSHSPEPHYRLIFQSLNGRSANTTFSAGLHLMTGAAALNGHMCGNSQHPGCLTTDEDVRIHSCEMANMCSVAKKPGVVSIRPVVLRLPNGESIMEAGVGGGGKDFSREAELDWTSNNDIAELIQSSMDSGMREEVATALQAEAAAGRRLSLKMTIDDFDENLSTGLKDALHFLCQKIRQGSSKASSAIWRASSSRKTSGHAQWIKDGRNETFEHDRETASCFEKHAGPPSWEHGTPEPDSQQSFNDGLGHCPRAPVTDPAAPVSADQRQDDTSSRMEPLVHADTGTLSRQIVPGSVVPDAHDESFSHAHRHNPVVPQGSTPTFNDFAALPSRKGPFLEAHGDSDDDASTDSFPLPDHTISRYEAYHAMLSNSAGTGPWMAISLLSTDAHHGVADTEL